MSADADFLSGASGAVGGLDGVRRELRDRLHDARELADGSRLRLAAAARRTPPTRRVTILGVVRPEHRALARRAHAELMRSRHDVQLHLCSPAGPGEPVALGEPHGPRMALGQRHGPRMALGERHGPGIASGPGEASGSDRPGGQGRFENLNRLLEAHPPQASDSDWLLTIDDDVVLPRGFLDGLLCLAERFAFDLAQPAHRLRSHAAWEVTRRRQRTVARETRFVEIGPVTLFARSTFAMLLPFPELRMGWGLDLHWAALAREHGWRLGVIDAVAIGHTAAPAASTYSREQAVAEAREFLIEAKRPYLSAREAQATLATHRRLAPHLRFAPRGGLAPRGRAAGRRRWW